MIQRLPGLLQTFSQRSIADAQASPWSHISPD